MRDEHNFSLVTGKEIWTKDVNCTEEAEKMEYFSRGNMAKHHLFLEWLNREQKSFEDCLTLLG
jgi:hypothetical protein